MPNSARNHDENRKVVCLLCLKKANRQLTTFLHEKIQQVYRQQINFEDVRVPQGLCKTSRTALRKRYEGHPGELPALFDFETIIVKPLTRGNPCECLICCIGWLKLTEKHPLDTDTKEEKISNKRCSKCLSLIGRRLPHQFSVSQFRENIRSLAANDGKVAEQIASSTITSKDASPHGTVRLSQTKSGREFPITPGPSSAKQLLKDHPVVTAQDLAQVQINTGLSNNGIRKLATTINNVSTTKVLEPYIVKKFQNLGKNLKESFTQITAAFTNADKTTSNYIVAYCKSLNSLIEDLLLTRKIFSNHVIKLGINGG
ncbi:uncharacterized protein LOC124807639 isoform X2 [Hydra vulgaris]|uniref:uncharacterized protein LOC124807639 isoform X2 n=1 Tax=Hydra vulgaris TaxID=6087 RepID=UPI001F5F4A08|nr:uncharacterized protein LOC124807639 isoform X2 [Hydra vulgaris]